MMGIIYLATNLTNGKEYIGQTTGSSVACRKYKSVSRKPLHPDDRYFERALKKYGYEGFAWLVLFSDVSDCDLDRLEIESIRKYGTLHPGGYNLRSGGSNGRMSEVTRLKLSQAQKMRDPLTRLHTPQTKALIAESNRRRVYSAGTITKLANSCGKLNELSVLEIRNRYAAGEVPRSIAKDYGIGPDNVLVIVRGSTWKHVGGPIGTRPKGAQMGNKNAIGGLR